MPDPHYMQPEPATVLPSPWRADVKPFKPYVYQGQGFDLYDPASGVPESCTCTWSWGPPSFRWERIEVKEDCPWHRLADQIVTMLARKGKP